MSAGKEHGVDHRHRPYGYCLVLPMLAALSLIPSGRALADTFQVTKTLDTRDGKCDADCSLREAIIAANQHPGPDTVMVPAGKYLLQQVGQDDQAAVGDLDILDDLTLIGAGAETTLIDGNHIDRVFEIHSAAVVRLTGLTIQNGRSLNGDGGGIYNQAGSTLTLENCTLSGNSGGGNSARTGTGGGIYNGGTLMLENCTLSGNSAFGSTGGGGGIYNQTGGTATLTNCTLSGNLARTGGGGISNGGTATLTNCTLSGNSGGGIYNSRKATLSNTIIANSSGGERNCPFPVTSNGYNLDDDGSCGFFAEGDISIMPANLAPLGDYGGPTQTHALCTEPGVPHPDCQAASPAIDAGDNAHCPATDQRGAPRPQGSACDIGAYESGADAMPGTCQGDCGNDGAVTVNEIITMVNIALGGANVSACTAGDADASGDITINEIIAAVSNALSGCP